MYEQEGLDGLLEDEIIKLYELFFGPILIKKDINTYVLSLKSLLVRESNIDRIIEKLNTNELEILQLLSRIKNIPYSYINEKLSIVLGEHPSIIGKMLHNLTNKHFIFVRNERSMIIPSIFHFKSDIKMVKLHKIESKDTQYNHEQFTHVVNVIVYMISKDIKFSKAGTLYKKDFENISLIFNGYTGFVRDEYNLIAYAFSSAFIKDEMINWKEIDKFFKLSQFERMGVIVKKLFPYLWPLVAAVYETQSSCRLKLNEFKYLYKYFLISTELTEEPFRSDIDDIIVFLVKIGLFTIDEDEIIINYFDKSSSASMSMKVSSNYSIYVNSDSTAQDYYYSALFGDFIKYDKVAELEINDLSIKKAIHNGFDFLYFTQFMENYGVELTANVNTTIKTWFDKHSSYYFVEGTLFFCDTVEKGKIISRLIEGGVVTAHEIKKDTVFLIPQGHKNEFFEFLDKSGITYFEKKPKKLRNKENQVEKSSTNNYSEVISIE